VHILDLRPTQITVGLREVAQKRAEWRAESPGHRPDFLGKHLIPAVLGPKHRYFLIDHHHLARALHDEGVEDVAVSVAADLSGLTPEAFWVYLDNRSWTHLYDARAKRRTHKQLPKDITGLVDDPYRSLAGALRRAGGYAKDTMPFAEFLWADFLRRRIKHKLLELDYETAVEDALTLAKSQDAAYLPGWCGPVPPG